MNDKEDKLSFRRVADVYIKFVGLIMLSMIVFTSFDLVLNDWPLAIKYFLVAVFWFCYFNIVVVFVGGVVLIFFKEYFLAFFAVLVSFFYLYSVIGFENTDRF